jgi:hypothetical protein
VFAKYVNYHQLAYETPALPAKLEKRPQVDMHSQLKHWLHAFQTNQRLRDTRRQVKYSECIAVQRTA